MLGQLLPAREPGVRTPVFQRSRCLRMRHRGNGCARCLDACPHRILDFNNDPVIDAAACNSCFQCTAACPTDALTVRDFDFGDYLREVDAASNPVIGCAASRAGMRTGAIPCLGLFSDIHLLTLGMLKKKISIDIGPCRTCGKGPIAQAVQDRLARLRSMLPPENINGIRLQTDLEPLPPASRRDFFTAIRSTFIRQVSSAIKENAPSPAGYGNKALPHKRKLLNQALRSAGAGEKEQLAKTFFFLLTVNERCDLCFACMAACPSGALRKIKEAERRILLFQSASCSGCGLCVDFCRRQAILLQPAESAGELFGWRPIHR